MIQVLVFMLVAWVAYHCLKMLVLFGRQVSYWFVRRRHRRIDREWEAIGYIEVRQGQYMAKRDFTAKQLRYIESGSRVRSSTVKTVERRH